MLAHLCLKYRTDSEGLQQQETLDALPKAIRSSVSHFLFYSLMDKVYMFRGVSNDFLFQLVNYLECMQNIIHSSYFYLQIWQVSELKAEYFPPKEDVILQNEAPTDFYILVKGTAVIKFANLFTVLLNRSILQNARQIYLSAQLFYGTGLGCSQQ